MSVPAQTPLATRAYGAQSMSAPLREVLVVRPGVAFGAAYDDPAHGFLHACDLELARREHAAFVTTLGSLGPTVHVLDGDELGVGPDSVYPFDPLLVTDRGAIALRPGKPNRRGEPAALEAWMAGAGIPLAGRVEAPGTIEGGDTLWLRPDLFCIGRTLRTNDAGARQLAGLVGGDVRIFDVPYWRGPAELIHLMSVISPIADDLAVVFLPLLPVGLWELLNELGIRMIEVPEEEFATLGCNVLAVRPGVVILADGNPATSAALEAAGCEVHTYPATEIGINGSGGPTCMTRPILRASRPVTGAVMLADAEARAAAAVDPAWAIEVLRTLVRVRSVTGDEVAVQDVMAGRLADLGCAVERLEREPAAFARDDPDWPGAEMPRDRLPVVLGRLGRSGGRRVLLVGHVDVVPPGDLATWHHDPWAADLEGGRVYGRGAVDMKGGVTSILAAVRAIRAAGLAELLDGELLVVSVPSEEDGGQGMLAAIRAGAVGDLAIITEPSDLDVVIAHAGALTFRLTVPGKAAHASVRREGISALDNLMTLVRALEDDEETRNAAERDPLMTALGLPYPTIIGKVNGGEWASTVLDRVVAEGRYGVKLGQTWRDAEADLRRCIDRAAAEDPFLRDHPPTLELTGGKFSSARIPADHPLPVGLADLAEAVTGRRPALLGEPYGADMRLLVNEGRTPTVIFGPGVVTAAHAADEWVPLDQVVACARTLAAWVVRELGVAPAAAVEPSSAAS